MADTPPKPAAEPSRTQALAVLSRDLVSSPTGQSGLVGLVVAAVVSGSITIGGDAATQDDLEAVQRTCEEGRAEVREVARELRVIREELIRANPDVRLTP